MRRHQHAQQISEDERRSKVFMIGVAIAFPIVFLGAFVALSRLSGTPPGTRPDQGARIQAEDGVVQIPLVNIGPKAIFYQYKTRNNKTVRIFAIKTSDGEYRVGQNACDACYRKKMGYHQEGGDLVCNSCLRRTPSASVDTATDGCAKNTKMRAGAEYS